MALTHHVENDSGHVADHNQIVDHVNGTTNVHGITDMAAVVFTTDARLAAMPAGGTSGMVLTKDSSADYDTSWATPTGGTGGAVDSVDGFTGAVSLPVDGSAATGTKRTLGTGASQAAAGNDSRFTTAAITGGTISGITDLAIADGGTGASTASAARSNFGLGGLAVLSTVGTSELTDNSVTAAKMADMANSTIRGRVTAGTGDPEDLTVAQTKTLLAYVPGDITGFDTQVRTSRLDQMAAPTAAVSMNSQRITNVLDPTADQNADTRGARNAAITALPTLTTSDTGVMPIATVSGPPAVTTLDVSHLVTTDTAQSITSAKTMTGPLLKTDGSHGITFGVLADVTYVNDYATRTNMIEIFGNVSANANVGVIGQSGTSTTPAATTNGAILGRITFRGTYDAGSSVFTPSAAAGVSIFAAAEEVVTSTNQGTKLSISVRPKGTSTALTETFKLNAETTPNVVIRNALVLGAGSSMADVTTGYGLEVKAGAIGYGTGAGGAVTQGTSRSTTVVKNTQCGTITIFTATAVVGTWLTFTLTNSVIAAGDVVAVSCQSPTNTYVACTSHVGSGTCKISFMSIAGTSSDTPLINFAVIKSVTS